MESGEYCREIEAYLCRKNDGHLIRIAGPTFERVCGWAGRGIPLKIAFRGIDRCFERYYAKGERRRPVRVDYCEADILDLFDAWRRAVGVREAAAAEDSAEFAAEAVRQPSRHRPGLTAHLDRVLDRTAARRAEAGASGALSEALDRTAREVAGFKELATPARGEARARVRARLVDLDREIVDAARQECPPAVLAALQEEAAGQLEPFRERMPEDAYRRAIGTAVDRLLRERERLPVLTFE
jgi:hypothetical protein